MPEPLVTVATFTAEAEAYLAKMRLEEEGIECVVANAISNALWFDGVRLQVKESDASRAVEVLEAGRLGADEEAGASAPEEAEDDADEEPEEFADEPPPAEVRCPGCDSTNVARISVPRPVTIWTVLLLGLPLLFPRQEWACLRCGRHWHN